MNEGTQQAKDQRDPDEIERDIDRTRSSLGRTIDELENRLSPGQMVDQVLDVARRHGGDFATNLGRSAQNHPMPLLLTTVGVAWMIASANQPPPPARARTERGAGSGLTDRASGAKHRMQHGVESAKSAASAVGDRASRASHAVGDSVSQASERVREQSQRMRQGFSQMMEEQPLIVGAMGIALGAALGAVLPRSEAEDRLLGDTRDSAARAMKERASETFGEVKHKAEDVAASVRQRSQDSQLGDRTEH